MTRTKVLRINHTPRGSRSKQVSEPTPPKFFDLQKLVPHVPLVDQSKIFLGTEMDAHGRSLRVEGQVFHVLQVIVIKATRNKKAKRVHFSW